MNELAKLVSVRQRICLKNDISHSVIQTHNYQKAEDGEIKVYSSGSQQGD